MLTHQMESHVFNRKRRTVYHFKQVAVSDPAAVKQNCHSCPYCFHLSAVDQQGGILLKTNTRHRGATYHHSYSRFCFWQRN